MNSLLSFIQGGSVEEVVPGKRTGGGVRKQYQPASNILAIRVFRDGSVFPSDAAIAQFDLEYKKALIEKEELPKKEGQTEVKTKNVYSFPNGTGNGFDIIDSRIWQQFKSTTEGGMLFIIPTPKDAAKVDLFGTTNYNADGTPKSMVGEQGAATFGKDVLIPAIEQLYGVVFHVPAQEAKEGKAAVVEVPGVDFVDLAIFEKLGDVNINEKYGGKILYIPKRVTRGADAGKPDYIRREEATIYGLAPAEMVIPGYVAKTVPVEKEEE